jgi:hypothetical protein
MSLIPTIEELHDPESFDLYASVEQNRIKDFVLQQVMSDKKFIPVYMIYQTLLFIAGIFLLTRSVVLAYKGNLLYLLYTAGAVVFSLTFLVVIHEFLHGTALKLAGAPKVTFGGILSKFIFFAEADQFVMNRKTFLVVAFTPFVVVKMLTIAGILLFFNAPSLYFFLVVMVIHSFFCSGDVALVTIFYRFPGRDTFTYDNSEEKKSYYFVKKL